MSQIDLATGQRVDYRNAGNLGTAIGFGELVSSTLPVYAANDFNYVLKKGILLNNANNTYIWEYSFAESSTMYELLLGMVPKRKGVFSISV